MNNQPITDYSERSTQELEAMLAAELDSSDPAVSLAILEELAKRTAEAPDADAAWNSFQKNYLPLDGSLYTDEAPPKKARVYHFGRKLGAAALAACLACMLIVQAGGTDILRTMVRWDKDQLHLSSPTLPSESSLLPEAGSQDAAEKAASSSAPGAEELVEDVEAFVIEPEVTQYASLSEGLAAIGLEELTPTAIPEGFTLESVELLDLSGWKDLTALYFNETEDLLRFSYTCHGEDSVFSTVVAKDESEVEVLDLRGTTFYLVSNGHYQSVSWMQDEQTECRVGGPVTREELKALVESMYE